MIFLSVNVEVGTARPAASAYEPAAHNLIKVCLEKYIYRYVYIYIEYSKYVKIYTFYNIYVSY